MRKSFLGIALLLIVPFAVYAQEHEHQHPAAPASPGFDKMKALVGEWKATLPGMGDVTTTYALYSDNSALLETMNTPHGTMLSVYYPTADGVAMTHYCAAHNQPSMSGKLTGDAIDFKATTVANLKSKDDAHMSGVKFMWKDADHVTAAWTHKMGARSETTPFEYARVK